MQNPQLKEMIIQEYQQGLNAGNGQTVPPMMGKSRRNFYSSEYR